MPASDTGADPGILVLDDGALGFRLSTAAASWPEALRGEPGSNLEWVVLKMAGPICKGDLWRTVGRELGEKTVVVVSINDIRREDLGLQLWR